MKKVLLAALLASVTLSATAAQTIRFATEASYPPFESIDANNKIVGFDVDLANALCKEIDATCTFSNQAFDSLIMDKHPEITTVPYDSYQNAKLDLQNGRIDGVFGDTAVVTEWLKANDKLAPVGDKVTDKDYFGTGLGIAVRQGNTELQQKFNAALEKVKKDGTYETIYKKWFQK